MSAIKFSKQFIEPNPQEVDYWVDISTNPYGGVIKYYNGETWTVLTSPDGTPINMDAFYNKLQINQMLATKASVESVESKVDDTELSDLMNNIEFKGKDGNGVDMIIFKYDGTNVGITLPTASNTTAGIITKDQFKDLVKQNQLQSLYSEMYSKVTEVYLKFQKKLKAGKNIRIDETTNTIHATGKISTDWNDLTNVPDLALQPDLEKEVERATNAESILDTRITSHVTTVETSLDLKADKANTYTKDQIDSKLSGVYRIKGSCLFEQLPTDPTVGDTWNILNDFTLNDEEHPFGTNVVYTDNGWDALAGIFDSSELEGDVQGVAEALAQETIRAVKAEQANADAIVAETERAAKAEETLQANVDIVDGKLVNYVLKKSVGDLDIISTNAHAVFNLHANATNICGIRLYANGLYGGGVWTDTEKQTAYIQNNLVSSQLLGIGTNGAYFHYSSKLSLLLHEGNYSNYALPLSGGIVNGEVIINNRLTAHYRTTLANNAALAFIGGDNTERLLMPHLANNYELSFNNGQNTSWYRIWHSGNDGEGSGLDADMLDGLEGSYYTPLFNATPINLTTTDNLNDVYSGFYGYLDGKNPENAISTNCAVFAFKNTRSADAFQIAMSANDCKRNDEFIHTRGIMAGDVEGSTWSDWKTIAFTDSDITGNAATATKLSTPVYLWGRQFDGTTNIDGNIKMGPEGGGIGYKAKTGDWTYFPIHLHNAADDKVLFRATLRGTDDTFTNLSLGPYENSFVITKNNYVGIGTTNPQYKLDVNGLVSFGTINFNTHYPSITVLNEDNSVSRMIDYNHTNKTVSIGYDNQLTDKVQLFGKEVRLYNNSKIALVVANEKVGIGTGTPAYKLDVNGTAHATSFVSDVNTGYYLKDGNGNSFRVLCIPSTNYVSFGHDTAANGYKTTIEGNELLLRYGTKHTDGIILNSSGNVTIGSSDLAGNVYKLYVDGKTKCASSLDVTNSVGIGDSLFVTDQIAMGDYVDWYGVSWSEDSPDPTCTRIGNMALHRSLPILSAMKGYFISNINSDVPESIIPMNDTWSGTNFSTTGNDAIAVEDLSNGSVMVKIPEFWYIDEYESSTKTHNLKISQTAKAGWCHHKEAYVGAYEGYNSGNYYKSIKGVTPTVSVSRTTLRPLARANGYEDEYKWNIYTYEEHRAICHLFLVEYATRNSQLAVNTALTSDGFKQGGLGSGCTTDAVTINGVTTYSFIPTGTTDSLGNGSGQVAYTVTQTDANGNETGTITRYANRYRGIENPFGHILKHVDDIVNVYNATTTYKTVYKCDKPEHFATNKNAKYKPLCSFPGGTKMQGWSKEIKATINCDFFKYSIGGSESTYWCDYNYDNDDTSEHCLLIGGHSVAGGSAGLFHFHLAGGAGYSGALIGSRLTYLPWAE